jgi:hypothetical protein
LISELLCQFEYRMAITVACIWLVNDDGEYEQTTDREFLLKYFEIERLSDETNFYGTGKRPLAKLRKITSGRTRSGLTT